MNARKQPNPQYRWVRPVAICGVCKQCYEVPESCMEKMRAEWRRFESRDASDQEIVQALQPNLCAACGGAKEG